MQKGVVNSNYKFDKMISIMKGLESNHSQTKLIALRNELNAFFNGARCREVIYTNNTDKLFFGMRVYPNITGDQALQILNDSNPITYDCYYVEIDSKLLDPMLNLSGRELTAVLLHEVGHIVYDTSSTDEVKKHIDKYFANADESLSMQDSINHKELLAYALKDCVVKSASLFTKFGNEEVIADTFVVGCGFGPDLDSAFKKILSSSTYLNKDVDDRFIVMSWVLRLYTDVKVKRLPAVKTLNKAKALSASELEKRELDNAIGSLNKMTEAAFYSEGYLEEGNFNFHFKAKLNKKFSDFKYKGIRGVKDDIYEFNLRLRTIETEEDALILIRAINSDISILEDYLKDPGLSQAEIESTTAVLHELYDIRQRAAKDANIRGKYDSLINVVYPNI